MSKYDRLSDHLRSLAVNSWTAGFDELERLLGFRLPFSARNHQAWWGNNGASPQARSWLDAGWKVGSLRQSAEMVVFLRTARAASAAVRWSNADAEEPSSLPDPAESGRMNSVAPHYDWDTADKIDCRISFQWQPIGRVILDLKNMLSLPPVPADPGLYRFQISSARGHSTYIGETENLARRFQGYRTPGVGQLTNIRIRDKLLEALREEDEVSVAIVNSGAEMLINNIAQTLDFMCKPTRLIMESAALLAGRSDTIESLNR